jgi:hypothetical protein
LAAWRPKRISRVFVGCKPEGRARCVSSARRDPWRRNGDRAAGVVS